MINDETLILYFYNDGLSANEREHLEEQLTSDQGLASRYAKLQHELQSLQPGPAPVAPAHSIARWRQALDTAVEATPDSQSNRWWRRLLPVAMVAATALVLVLGIGIGQRTARDPAPAVVVNSTPPVQPLRTPQSALTRSLALHLQQARVELASLSTRPTDQRAQLITGIIYQNRLFQQAADASGSPDLARLLRAFEPVLMSMLLEDGLPLDISGPREQLDFELGMTLTKLTGRSSNYATEL